MRAGRTLTAVIGGLAVAASVAACGGSSSGGGKPGGGGATSYVSNGTLSELIPSDPGNLDPLLTVNTATLDLDALAYDPIVNLAANGQVVSGLASKWSGSGKTYTFTLRRDVTCSDGSKLSASTVAANLNFVSNPKDQSPLISVAVPADSKATADNAASTVTLTTPTVIPFLLQDISQLDIVCAKGLADPKSLAQATDGTGAYMLSNAVPGEQYNFTVHHGYAWGPDGATTSAKGIPAKLQLKVVTDATTAANELLAGQANIATVYAFRGSAPGWQE